MRLEPICSKAMRVCTLLLILSTAGATASAQSLADLARKESERRQTVQGAGKTYTDKDLKPVPAPPQADAGATPAPADKPADGKETPSQQKPDSAKDTGADKAADGQSETKDEAYWSKRMAALREQLERDETYLSALQNRIDSLTADFVGRDDPAQRGQIASERQKALAELDRLRKAVEADKRAIPELEEEARREGVPAGWLR
jgi:hypothetical protein